MLETLFSFFAKLMLETLDDLNLFEEEECNICCNMF